MEMILSLESMFLFRLFKFIISLRFPSSVLLGIFPTENFIFLVSLSLSNLHLLLIILRLIYVGASQLTVCQIHFYILFWNLFEFM